MRNHFSVVPQATFIFLSTIYDKLILANPHGVLTKSSKTINWQKSIQRFSSYHKLIKPALVMHGKDLDDEQKQSIPIAKALLKQSKILIFDKAVSNSVQQTTHHLNKLSTN